MFGGQPLIKVSDLIKRYSIEELIITADEYFSHANIPALKRKPFNVLSESPEILLTFSHVAKGLDLPIESTILDFGAGSCWTSKYLSDYGYNVIASDVSKTALEIGSHVTQDALTPVTFLLFDGHRIDLPDESVDGITCLSAFHHVPNPDVIIREFARILKPWGVAAFSEPGPHHSKSPQSQEEMRSFTVIENDVDIDAVWKTALSCGFTSLEMNIFYPEPILTSLSGFKGFLAGHSPADMESKTRSLMQERRLFFMEKGLSSVTTSGTAEGLDAKISLAHKTIYAPAGSRLSLTASVKNTGSALWRNSDWYCGPVRLGPSYVMPDERQIFSPRWMLPKMKRRGVLPGETILVEGEIQIPDTPGKHKLKLEMVSESVAWFGAPTNMEVNAT